MKNPPQVAFKAYDVLEPDDHLVASVTERGDLVVEVTEMGRGSSLVYLHADDATHLMKYLMENYA